MTQSQLLEFLSQLASKGVVVTVNMNVVVEPDKAANRLDDGEPVAPPDIPDFSYYYGNWSPK